MGKTRIEWASEYARGLAIWFRCGVLRRHDWKPLPDWGEGWIGCRRCERVDLVLGPLTAEEYLSS